MHSFPILSVAIWLPIVFGVAVLAIGSDKNPAPARWLAVHRAGEPPVKASRKTTFHPILRGPLRRRCQGQYELLHRHLLERCALLISAPPEVPPREEPVHDESQRPYVGRWRHGRPDLRLLRCPPKRGPEASPRSCRRGLRLVQHCGDTKVKHLDRFHSPHSLLLRNEDVLGFQIPMDNGNPVRGREGVAQLPDDPLDYGP